jgi:Domain of unknown function (DUF4136)
MKRFSIRTATAWIGIAAAALLLAGCSGMRIIDSDVTAFPAWTTAPPAPGASYRFERLPSQQLPAMQQDRIEDIARASLAKVGMVPDAANPRFAVQAVFATQMVARYAGGPFGYGGPGVFVGAGSYGRSLGLSFPFGYGDSYYQREVRLTVREVASQRVVFETRAVNENPWGDTFAVLPAMFDAALLGFPQPPAGLRRVNVEIPR